MRLIIGGKSYNGAFSSGKAVIVNIDGQKYYTSKKFVNRLILGELKKLKLKRLKLGHSVIMGET